MWMSDAAFWAFSTRICTRPRPNEKKPSARFLASQQAQDEVDIELIVVKKIIKRQEGVPHLKHRRDRRKDPFHE